MAQSDHTEAKPSPPSAMMGDNAPIIIVKRNVTGYELEDKVDVQQVTIERLLSESAQTGELLMTLEKRIIQLEYDNIEKTTDLVVKNQSIVKLQEEVTRLEQFTRRYSVLIEGVKKSSEETQQTLEEEVKKLITETASKTTFGDVDKIYRDGPEGALQNIIIRFKTHSAKEEFYKKRRNITRRFVRVKPFLCPRVKTLLEEANTQMEPYLSNPEYPNPPEFVFADVYGRLLVKMKKPGKRKGMFHEFQSIQQLFEIIQRCQ